MAWRKPAVNGEVTLCRSDTLSQDGQCISQPVASCTSSLNSLPVDTADGFVESKSDSTLPMPNVKSAWIVDVLNGIE